MSVDRSVGVRELRQNLSVYLRRVLRGETLEVTDRGRPVALLAPLPQADSSLDRLIARGDVVAPAGDILELAPPEGPPTHDVSEALQAERGERL